MKRISILSTLLCCLMTINACAQDDLLNSLISEAAEDSENELTTSTFKSTRVINSHSVETLAKGNLDFRIAHRFGKVNSGAYNFFGLDQATIRLALEYGISDRLSIGIGRSSFQKTIDGFAKYKLIRQRERGTPLSITAFSNFALTTLRNGDVLLDETYQNRFSYCYQLILARKFSGALSWQVAPLLIHRNLKEAEEKTNDALAIETGGRFKISNRVSINMDYIYRLPGSKLEGYYDSFSLGVDIETGGHVFQLHITNSQGMIEQLFVTRTEGQWSQGDIYYGFNVSRRFDLSKKRN